ncbi:hypothetical protein EW146_g1408 [Bondarzewia mesenterica]|uniref:Rrn7/TAF1B C-terminal cyclin domain-containing protein n=1 Tax=Bondarzewia mesenterica TaxID=1095465 RepID=A0A4S4M5T6_9AGAM|nr:hypothetical protein EW146_g1408 [Bondarzewia mesenterica]
MAPRRRCPVCGSKQWHKEPASGLVICSEGHILQSYRNETADAGDFGPHTMRKRALKSGRKKREDGSKADPKLYHGARAQYHYFQCLQMLLRKQVAALTKLWDLPPEFEARLIICRDVWALHLSLLPSPPPPEPWLHEQDVGGNPSKRVHDSANPKLARTKPEKDEGKSDLGEEPSSDKDGHETSNDSSSSSSSSSESEEESESDEGDTDPEMDELLRDLSETSSSVGDGNHGDDASDKPRPKPHKRTSKIKSAAGRHDGPASNIAVLVLACWTIRLPIIYMDLIRLIEAHDLPYLEPIRHLPPEMMRHLTKHKYHQLTPPYAPTPLFLQVLSSRLARRMLASRGIYTPELNAAPILWRAVRAMGGTPVLYSLTKIVARVLNLPLTLHHTLAPGLLKIRKRDPESHKYDDVPPEVALAASVIVVLKMVYGLDGKARTPKDAGDPACALPRMREYLALIKELNEEDSKSKESVFAARSNLHPADLSESMMDEYLDFCEKALIGGPDSQSRERVLDQYFPLSAKETVSERTNAEKGRMAASRATVPVDDAELEPGEEYTIYNSRDVLGTVPDAYDAVMERASRWTGVPEEYLCGVTEKYERRVVRWWDGIRRKESRERGQEREDEEGGGVE